MLNVQVIQEETMIERIKRLMESKGLSQAELARRAEIDKSTLSNILSGTRTAPTVETLRRLAGALGTTIEHLRGIDNTKPPPRSIEAEKAADMIDKLPPDLQDVAEKSISVLYNHYQDRADQEKLINDLLDIIEANEGLAFRLDLERRLGITGGSIQSSVEAPTF